MTEVWWLKLKRAQEHMAEIKREIRRYQGTHPYEPVRVAQVERKKHVWLYKLRITEQPSPMLGVIIGEYFYNLRSALDNIVAASVPRKKRHDVSFPISWDDPLAPEHVHGKVEISFREAVDGLDDKAKAIIYSVQPFQSAEKHAASFGIIARLNNADKHRELLSVAPGLSRTILKVVIQGRTEHHGRLGTAKHGIVYDDTVLARWEWDGDLSESEVEVKVNGMPTVTIKVPAPDNIVVPSFDLRNSLLCSISDVRWILGELEPFVRRRN